MFAWALILWMVMGFGHWSCWMSFIIFLISWGELTIGFIMIELFGGSEEGCLLMSATAVA